jgi:hypothetical protein
LTAIKAGGFQTPLNPATMITRRLFMRVALLLMVLALAGCATPRAPGVYTVTAPFDASQAQQMLSAGTGTVKGRALFAQSGGGVVTCAGNEASLVPATAYAAERMKALYLSDERGSNLFGARVRAPTFAPDPADYHRLMRKTRCDAQGYFSFDNVAEGDFFVTTTAWSQVGSSPQGGNLMKRVHVQPNATIEFVLSP